jgi:uncharacterized protein YjbI with pentapeptide repeats
MGANLCGATLSGHFSRADFMGADLTGATLSGQFSRVDFEGANLEGAIIEGSFESSDFLEARLPDVHHLNGKFSHSRGIPNPPDTSPLPPAESST